VSRPWPTALKHHVASRQLSISSLGTNAPHPIAASKSEALQKGGRTERHIVDASVAIRMAQKRRPLCGSARGYSFNVAVSRAARVGEPELELAFRNARTELARTSKDGGGRRSDLTTSRARASDRRWFS
jgi:hypothetical protein